MDATLIFAATGFRGATNGGDLFSRLVDCSADAAPRAMALRRASRI